MREIALEIRRAVEEALPVLAEMSSESITFKSSPEKWSKKEILGHLIDSAANNHQRFVRAVYNVAASLPGYNQNAWVAIQGYQDMEWTQLLQLWVAYNLHLCRIIERIPSESLSFQCGIGQEEPVPLEWVVRDYLSHLNHHLGSLGIHG